MSEETSPLVLTLRRDSEFLRTFKHKPIGGYYSLYEFVLKNGRSFDPKHNQRPKRLGTVKRCFMNTFHAVRRSKEGLIYCEGFIDVCGLPLLHAWACTPTGKLVETTLSEPADGYYGVTIRSEFVAKMARESGVYGVIDSHEQNFPILTAPVGEWKHEV